MMKFLGHIAVCLALILGGVAPATAYNALPKSNFSTANTATAGDSIMAQGFSSAGGVQTGGAYSYTAINQINMLRGIMGGRINMPLNYNFAVSGSYCNVANQIPAYYQNAINSGAVYIFGDACRNDLAGGVTASSILSSILPTLAKVSNSPSHLIFMPILPESNGTTWTTLQNQYRIVINRTMYELCSGLRPDLVQKYGFNPDNLPVVLDASFMEDFTTGNRLSGWGASDGIHLEGAATFRFAQQDANIIQSPLPPRPTYFAWFYDYYDATNNPQGNLLYSGTTNLGLMTGTGGSVYTFNGITPTGSVATGFQALRSSGNSTATFVLSKEATRADGLTGTGQVEQIDCSAGSNGEQYRLQYVNTIPVVAGKTVYIQATVQLLDQPINYLGSEIYLVESGNTNNQSTQDGAPNTSDTTVSGPGQPFGDFYLRAPPFVVQAGTTALTAYEYTAVNCATTGHAKVAVRDFAVHYQ